MSRSTSTRIACGMRRQRVKTLCMATPPGAKPWRAVGIGRASVLIVSFIDARAAERVLRHVRELVPGLPVVVRTFDGKDHRLQRAGAAEVVPETLEASMMLASHALIHAGCRSTVCSVKCNRRGPRAIARCAAFFTARAIMTRMCTRQRRTVSALGFAVRRGLRHWQNTGRACGG